MPRSYRNILALLILTAALGVAAPSAHAQKTPQDRAEELNDEGKELYRKGDYAGAANKFRQAVVLSPEGRFYFNLCFVLEKQGKLREALTACDAVNAENATAELVGKTVDFKAGIEKRLAAAGGGGGTGGGGDGTGGDGGGGGGDGGDGTGGGGDGTGGDGTGGGTTGGGGTYEPPPPDEGVTAEADPSAYKWSLGADIGPLSNLGIGREASILGGDDAFSDSGVFVKLHIDFLISEARRLGLQGYINISNLTASESNVDLYNEQLSIVDLGGAIFQHRRLSGDWEWTPLAGAHIAVETVGQAEEALVTFGFRGEVAFSYVLGSKKQHVISITPAFNMYLPATGSTGTIDPFDYGLDQRGGTFAITVGYSARFKQAFGSAPIITLE